MSWITNRTQICREGENGGGAGAGGSSGAAGAGGAAGAPGGGGASPPWHDGIDATLLGVAQNKGWKLDSPKDAFAAATQAYKEAQSRLGVPAEELIRLPKPNAPEADVKVFLGRIGVPAEAKEYDLSTVKRADGTDVTPALADTLRTAMLDARVPKDRAAGIVQSVVKHMDGEATAAKADLTTTVKTEQDALRTNWGTKYDLNLQLAKAALEKLGAASGLTAAQIQSGWDALSKTGGIGASHAMEMLLNVSTRMGEAPFIGGAKGGDNQPLSQAAAKAEIDALKKDPQFAKRLLEGGREERRKWDNLHAIWQPRQQGAA